MQKVFYVSRNNGCADNCTPDMDRFQRIEKLNDLLALGWSIKEMKNEGESTYFVLHKADNAE